MHRARSRPLMRAYSPHARFQTYIHPISAQARRSFRPSPPTLSVDPSPPSCESQSDHQCIWPTTPHRATVTPTTRAGPVTLTDVPDTTTLYRGPVGSPPPTTGTPGLPTPYTYQTVVNGQTFQVADIYTPKRAPTVPVTIPATGSILDYDAFTSIYGTAFKPLNDASRLAPSVTLLCAAMYLVFVPYVVA